MKNISIIQGNRFNIYVPIVVLTTQGANTPDLSALNIEAVLVNRCGEKIEITANLQENFAILTYDTETLHAGAYSVGITGTYNASPINYYAQDVLHIVENNAQSDWQDYITTDHLRLDTQMFIAGDWVTSEELEALKAEYRQKIADAEQAQAQAETARSQAQGVAYDAVTLLSNNYAKQGSNAGATNTAILEAVQAGGGGGSFPTDYARQGSNAGATNTAILQAIEAGGGGSFPTDYAKQNTLLATAGDVTNIATDTTYIKAQGAKQNTSSEILSAVNAIAGAMYKGVPVIVSTSTAVNCAPNQRYLWADAIAGALTCNLTGAQAGIVNEYILSFIAGDGFSLTLVTDAELKWYGGNVPTWEAGANYEISIIVENNNALILWAKFN